MVIATKKKSQYPLFQFSNSILTSNSSLLHYFPFFHHFLFRFSFLISLATACTLYEGRVLTTTTGSKSCSLSQSTRTPYAEAPQYIQLKASPSTSISNSWLHPNRKICICRSIRPRKLSSFCLYPPAPPKLKP